MPSGLNQPQTIWSRDINSLRRGKRRTSDRAIALQDDSNVADELFQLARHLHAAPQSKRRALTTSDGPNDERNSESSHERTGEHADEGYVVYAIKSLLPMMSRSQAVRSPLPEQNVKGKEPGLLLKAESPWWKVIIDEMETGRPA
jgi:hypothetical protein